MSTLPSYRAPCWPLIPLPGERSTRLSLLSPPTLFPMERATTTVIGDSLPAVGAARVPRPPAAGTKAAIHLLTPASQQLWPRGRGLCLTTCPHPQLASHHTRLEVTDTF